MKFPFRQLTTELTYSITKPLPFFINIVLVGGCLFIINSNVIYYLIICYLIFITGINILKKYELDKKNKELKTRYVKFIIKKDNKININNCKKCNQLSRDTCEYNFKCNILGNIYISITNLISRPNRCIEYENKLLTSLEPLKDNETILVLPLNSSKKYCTYNGFGCYYMQGSHQKELPKSVPSKYCYFSKNLKKSILIPGYWIRDKKCIANEI